MQPPSPDVDARITELAARQHGVVTREQLVAAGVSIHRIEYRLKHGRLHALYSGVYRTGAVVSAHEPAMAALLACRPGATLCRRTAGQLWEVVTSSGRPQPIHVIARTRRNAPGPGVRVHRSSTLPDTDVTERDGMPITTPARTLLDLASDLEARELERAIAIAERQNLINAGELAALIDRHPHRRGVRTLRRIVGADVSAQLTRSEAEARFLDLIRRARLPPPETNVTVKGYEVDCLWQRERLIAEIDGFAFHSSAAAFERDRRRDAVLAAAGYHVVRITWKQLTRDSAAVHTAVAQALALRRGS